MELPKKINRKESKIDKLVLEWFEENWPNSCAVEVKVKGNKMYEHQKRALNKVAKGKFSYKIPDMGNRICFDGFVLVNADSFVVTCDGKVCDVHNHKNDETFTIKI